MTIPTQQDTIPLMSVFGWIIIHQHVDDTLNWDLPWANYKAGFGSVESNFWLGLENMHLLTSSKPYRLSIRNSVVANTLLVQFFFLWLTVAMKDDYDVAIKYRMTSLYVDGLTDWGSKSNRRWPGCGTQPSTGRSRLAMRLTTSIASMWMATVATPTVRTSCKILT